MKIKMKMIFFYLNITILAINYHLYFKQRKRAIPSSLQPLIEQRESIICKGKPQFLRNKRYPQAKGPTSYN